MQGSFEGPTTTRGASLSGNLARATEQPGILPTPCSLRWPSLIVSFAARTNSSKDRRQAEGPHPRTLCSVIDCCWLEARCCGNFDRHFKHPEHNRVVSSRFVLVGKHDRKTGMHSMLCGTGQLHVFLLWAGSRCSQTPSPSCQWCLEENGC